MTKRARDLTGVSWVADFRARDLDRTFVARTPVAYRISALDALRGVAMLLMLLDHLALVVGGLDEVRLTLGRLAMPLFFVLAGHLARDPRWRHLGIAAVGVVLPLVVPWIDAPNVLVIWAVGVVILWAGRRWSVPAWVVVVVALGCAANGWTSTDGHYDFLALWALMALGSILPTSALMFCARAPRWVATLGRFPISFYVGHLLVLHLFVLLAS